MNKIQQLIRQAETEAQEAFARIEAIEYANTEQVIGIFQEHQVAARHFAPTTGYGYDDVGRDTLERIFADLFNTEAAIVRPHIASGTHALSLCLFGLLLPGDHVLSATGMPYDTLDEVIGISSKPVGSLAEMGISFSCAELNNAGQIDLEAVREGLRPNTKVVMVQRSRGYAWRNSLMPQDIAPLSQMLKADYPQITLMVDNCYGEFVCLDEPSH
ncbi:MAG: methionine gamma-lyase family protein [Clostridia bacterium]|nr:methionine gamma-lyase family protein [Clostridia bacterium]